MPDHDPGSSLRLLTLNLWDVNGPVRRRIADLAAHLDERRPDVVALQEVGTLDGRTQAELVAEAAGYPHVHVDRAGQGAGRGQGLAVVSTLPVSPLPATPLPTFRRDRPRILQRVEVGVADTTLLVANTHLTWPRRHTALRAAQAERIREVLAADEGPRLLLGDLNDVVGSPALRVLTGAPPAGAGLVDAYAAAGRPARATFSFRNRHARPLLWLLGRRVDHVLAGRGLHVVDAEVVLDGLEGPVVSDHFGVRATLATPTSPPG